MSLSMDEVLFGYKKASDSTLLEDDDLADRWQSEAGTHLAQPQPHDVSMKDLRNLCSHGVPEEGSWRAVAWRILLGYLQPSQVGRARHALEDSRKLYETLCSEYFANGGMDSGKELQGHRGKQLQKQQGRHRRSNYADPDRGEILDPVEGAENSDHFDSEYRAPVKATTVLQQLSAQYQQAWKNAGLSLDAGGAQHLIGVENGTLHRHNLHIYGRNVLQVPPTLKNDHDQVDHLPEAEFEAFLEQARWLEEIRKDVVRTHPDLYFFLEPTQNLGMRRYAALERVLFVWAKLNKGVRYVQGMNEIAGTLYYVLANDTNTDWAEYAEPDTYWLFDILMRELRDVYLPDKDFNATGGMHARIANISRLLEQHDPQVHDHLAEQGIDASFYAIRWLTTILSREFLLPDTIRLWDSMFSSTHKENFLRYVCATMVMFIREDLLKGDFSACLRLLQSYPSQNVDQLLESSRSLYMYESQINIACLKGGISLQQALQTIHPPPSIVMAFGLRGGQVTSLSPSSYGDGRSNSRGVFGLGLTNKARQAWTEWQGSSPSTNPPDKASSFLLPWNRGRSLSAGKKVSVVAVNDESGHAERGTSGSNIWALKKRTMEASRQQQQMNLAPVGQDRSSTVDTQRSRLWNRRRTASADSADILHTPHTILGLVDEDPPARTSPYSGIWNGSRSDSQTTESSNSGKDGQLVRPPSSRISQDILDVLR